MRKLLLLLLVVSAGCSKDCKFGPKEKIILYRTQGYEVYSSKALFSESLKDWVASHQYIEEDKQLLQFYESHKNENPLDFYLITAKSVYSSRLEFRQGIY